MQFSQRRLHLRAGIHQAQNQASCTQSVFETHIHRAGIAGYTKKMLTVVKFMPVLLKARDFTALQLTSKQNIPLPKPRFHAGFFFCLFFHFFFYRAHINICQPMKIKTYLAQLYLVMFVLLVLKVLPLSAACVLQGFLLAP